MESLRRQSAVRKVQTKTSGAKIIVPIESPTYHVTQFVKRSAEETRRANQRVIAAIVGVMRQLADAASEKRKTSFSVASAVGRPTKRRTRNAPVRACRAAPPPLNAGTASDLMIALNGAAWGHVRQLTRKDT